MSDTPTQPVEQQPVAPVDTVPVVPAVETPVVTPNDSSLSKYGLIEVANADGLKQQMTKEQAANELARLQSIQSQLEAGVAQ